MLAAADFKAVVARDRRRRSARTRGIVWGLGAHVIKTGLGPVLIDLMERGFVSAIATNGAAIIHDFEVALVGATSEDVDEALGPGTLRHGRRNRPAAERARSTTASARASGIGQAVGAFLAREAAAVRAQQRARRGGAARAFR